MECAGPDSLEDFDNHVQKVLKYLDKKGTRNTRNLHRKLFSKLRNYLAKEGIPYTEDVGKDWIDIQNGEALKRARGAIRKLNQVYQGKEISGFHFGSWSKKNRLSPVWSQSLESYLDSVKEGYAPATVRNQQMDIQNAMLIIQDEFNMCEPSSIGIEQIAFLYNRMMDRNTVTKVCKNHTLESFSHYLKYLYSKNIVELYICISCDLLSHNVSFWTNLPPAIVEDILNNQLKGKKDSYSLEKLLDSGDAIFSEMCKTRYSYTALKRQLSHTKVFYCYLKWKKLPLTEGSVRIWLNGVKPFLTHTAYCEYQRTLFRALEWIKNHVVNFSIHYSDRLTNISKLPEWCRLPVEGFLGLKRKEGKSPRTLNMYKASCIRFCLHLDQKGIKNFEQLTPEIIKDFNLTDKHRTPEGKQAYNSRIRQFLLWLGEEKLCSSFIFLSIPTISVHREPLVVVLDTDEKAALDAWLADDDSGTLREKAVLTIGRRLGLRGVDITNLLIENIDWDNATIQIIQQKTQVGLVLPMPDDVADALYRYLMFERPESDDPAVFIATRAPYKKLDVSNCRKAMRNALPERNVPGSGFHVFRKTLATEMLQGGATPAETAEQLGHTSVESLRRYLSLNENKIQACALSPSTRGIAMEVDFS